MSANITTLDDNDKIVTYIHNAVDNGIGDESLLDYIYIIRKSLYKKYNMTSSHDVNSKIKELILSRLELGRHRYGHGIRINDDTTQFGTEDNDWKLMALEEELDGLIYTTADILRTHSSLSISPPVSDSNFNRSNTSIYTTADILRTHSSLFTSPPLSNSKF
jgi:hypothetical protein